MKKLKILAIQSGFDFTGGGSVVDYEIINELCRLGHHVRIIMPRRRDTDTIPNGAKPIYVPTNGLGFPQSLGLVSIPWIFKEVKRFEPDIIRDHSPYTYAIGLLTVCRIMKKPLVGSFHHSEENIYTDFVEGKLMRYYSRIITVSKFSASQLIRKDFKIADKIYTVYNGIGKEFRPIRFDKRKWCKENGLPCDEPIFCSVGSLIIRKNLMFLVDIFRRFVQLKRKGTLVIVGNGPELYNIKEYVNICRLDGKIHVWENIKRERQVELINASKAFLFPSKMEGFGLSVAEALSCGTPAIVSDRGALVEVVKDKENGFVLPLEEGVGKWPIIMKELSENFNLRKKLGINAVHDMKKRFSWESAGKQTEEIYYNLLNE